MRYQVIVLYVKKVRARSDSRLLPKRRGLHVHRTVCSSESRSAALTCAIEFPIGPRECVWVMDGGVCIFQKRGWKEAREQ